jgi:hypothetical protein
MKEFFLQRKSVQKATILELDQTSRETILKEHAMREDQEVRDCIDDETLFADNVQSAREAKRKRDTLAEEAAAVKQNDKKIKKAAKAAAATATKFEVDQCAKEERAQKDVEDADAEIMLLLRFISDD